MTTAWITLFDALLPFEISLFRGIIVNNIVKLFGVGSVMVATAFLSTAPAQAEVVKPSTGEAGTTNAQWGTTAPDKDSGSWNTTGYGRSRCRSTRAPSECSTVCQNVTAANSRQRHSGTAAATASSIACRATSPSQTTRR
jgi:hypothetical protein